MPDPVLQYGLCISIWNRFPVYISGKFTSLHVDSWESICKYSIYNVRSECTLRKKYCRRKRYNLFINKRSNRFKRFVIFNQSRREGGWYILILQLNCFPRASNICVLFWQKKDLTRFYEKEKKYAALKKNIGSRITGYANLKNGMGYVSKKNIGKLLCFSA